MFPKLKKFLGGRRLKSYEELKDDVREELHGLAAEVYDEGVHKTVRGYDMYRNAGGYYVEI
jgi:hypothetical protein